jgi:alpha-mannosidase
LSLLRSSVAPDPQADRGEHRFIYSLLPFTGSFARSRVVEAAYELNAGAVAEGSSSPKGGGTIREYSLCSLEQAAANAVIIECVKAPEPTAEGGGSLVLRLYESRGGSAQAVLRFARPVSGVMVTDMLEGGGNEAALPGGKIPLAFRPFEIKTLRIDCAE